MTTTCIIFLTCWRARGERADGARASAAVILDARRQKLARVVWDDAAKSFKAIVKNMESTMNFFRARKGTDELVSISFASQKV